MSITRYQFHIIILMTVKVIFSHKSKNIESKYYFYKSLIIHQLLSVTYNNKIIELYMQTKKFFATFRFVKICYNLKFPHVKDN